MTQDLFSVWHDGYVPIDIFVYSIKHRIQTAVDLFWSVFTDNGQEAILQCFWRKYGECPRNLWLFYLHVMFPEIAVHESPKTLLILPMWHCMVKVRRMYYGTDFKMSIVLHAKSLVRAVGVKWARRWHSGICYN